jgi:hypothetical protein
MKDDNKDFIDEKFEPLEENICERLLARQYK